MDDVTQNLSDRCRESSFWDAFQMTQKANLTDRCRKSCPWDAFQITKKANLTDRLGCFQDDQESQSD
eukprot:4138588-Karenia_brevis.AAC.1